MKKIWRNMVLFLLIALIMIPASGCSANSGQTESLPGAGKNEIRIRVFETTDLHGSLVDTSSGNEDTFQYRLARIARIVEEARASGEYDDVLLLDGGDIYQGTPVSNALNGAPVRAALDVMG